jgi:fluoride ion exporter CrcB/FEX
MALFLRLSEKITGILIAVNMVILLTVGLWPFSFDFFGGTSLTKNSRSTFSSICPGNDPKHKSIYRCETGRKFLCMGDKRTNMFSANNVKDYVLNFFGFIPLGFFLGIFLHKQKEKNNYRLVQTGVFLLPVMISVMLEYLQLFLPGRVSEVSDLILNSAGGILGILIGKIIAVKNY